MGDREKGGKRNTNKGEKERGEREGQDERGREIGRPTLISNSRRAIQVIPRHQQTQSTAQCPTVENSRNKQSANEKYKNAHCFN